MKANETKSKWKKLGKKKLWIWKEKKGEIEKKTIIIKERKNSNNEGQKGKVYFGEKKIWQSKMWKETKKQRRHTKRKSVYDEMMNEIQRMYRSSVYKRKIEYIKNEKKRWPPTKQKLSRKKEKESEK